MLAAIVWMLATIVLPPGGTANAQAYTTHCASCHGVHMDGSDRGPSLHGVGMADLDFWLQTGRMPAAAPWVEIGERDERSGQRLPQEQIAAIENYLRPVVGPPDIPVVLANGAHDRGHNLFALNCEHCHGASGNGGAIGGSSWAPDLHHAPITQVAEAMRAGPGQMPRFGPGQLSQTDLTDIASYVVSLRRPDPALPMRSGGPVPEGALGWVAIILLIMFVFVYWRGDTPPADRRDTVRSDAPARDPTSKG